ncbi:hypothetical protein MMC13_007136 [Lambiella insularis]|nr:hypothetical protein [Lambiella insularis]
MGQHRAHSGHSHSHAHDNTYLISKNKNDAGVRITRLGLFVNLGMAMSKGIGGYYFNSQALVADAFHAMTDLVSDFMTLATISVALRPPTAKYPNGFGKVESFGSLVVSGLLLAGGVAMGQHACSALYSQFFVDAASIVEHGHGAMGHSHSHSAADMIPNINAAWLAAGSIVIKEWLYRATMKIAKERKSSVLASNAVHHHVDSLTSIVALVAIGGSHIFTGATWLDPVGGLLVSLMVIQAGFGNTKAAVYELVDVAVDEEIKGSVRRAASNPLAQDRETSEVQVRDVQGLKAGQNYLMDIELAVPANWTIEQIRKVEDDIRLKIGSKVRGVRRVRVKFVAKDQQQVDFTEEFIGADISPPGSPIPDEDHDHKHEDKHVHSSTNDFLLRKMGDTAPLYLGFDLSTQQLKGLAVNSDLKVVCEAKYDFDADSEGFGIHKGVITNEAEHEVYAPVALWLQALDALLERLKEKGIDFSCVRGVSGAGQQHGSVYWSKAGEYALQSLDSSKPLADQLDHAFSHPFSPNWQDASTQKECESFDTELGGQQELADATGSKAHHRFTGPQILRFQRRYPDAYKNTSRISLVSSFPASILLGRIAPMDISDVCGMNLWDIKAGRYQEKLIRLASNSANTNILEQMLGPVHFDSSAPLGNISPYLVRRFGFDSSCQVAPFTGDNPATILALPLRPNDAIVSLGTSTTFLMSTEHYAPDPATHFFNHPTTPGLYMFMLCYKNGGLAREQIRDHINAIIPSMDHTYTRTLKSWRTFDDTVLASSALGQSNSNSDPMKIGLYFPKPEIVPNLPAGEWRYEYLPQDQTLMAEPKDWRKPHDDARAIVESQLLSLRLRSHSLVSTSQSHTGMPPQPRRVYLVGGGSQNKAIAKVAGEVLGGVEGIWKLDVGENACALGAAYKAVWTVERENGETFEDLIGGRWKEAEFTEKIAEGYQKGVWERYGMAVEGLEKMEHEILRNEGRMT